MRSSVAMMVGVVMLQLAVSGHAAYQSKYAWKYYPASDKADSYEDKVSEAQELVADYGLVNDIDTLEEIAPLRAMVDGTEDEVEEEEGEDCGSLEGYWYNQHGSELLLRHNLTTGRLVGEYRTATETSPGAAGERHSLVLGATSPSTPADQLGGSRLVGFTVSWEGGRSITSWSGQCAMCGGDPATSGQGQGREPKLITFWTLTSLNDHCHHSWHSNRVGQDIFTRYEQRDGPRKRYNTHVPLIRDYWHD